MLTHLTCYQQLTERLAGGVPVAVELEGKSLLVWTLLSKDERASVTAIEDLRTGRALLVDESNASIVI